MASIENGIDEIDAEGGAGKIVRVSGEVKTSPRPKARPTQPSVPDEVAIAMAEGIEGALAEATAPPAPAGTLEFQAEAMTEAPTDAPLAEATEADTALAAAELPETGVADALAAASRAPGTWRVKCALAATETAPAEPGTLEAQAAALATLAPLRRKPPLPPPARRSSGLRGGDPSPCRHEAQGTARNRCRKPPLAAVEPSAEAPAAPEEVPPRRSHHSTRARTCRHRSGNRGRRSPRSPFWPRSRMSRPSPELTQHHAAGRRACRRNARCPRAETPGTDLSTRSKQPRRLPRTSRRSSS